MPEEFDVDAKFEIQITGYSEKGVTLFLRLIRVQKDGFQEDAQNAMMGTVLKTFDYPELPPGSIIEFSGIKAKVVI